MKRLSIRPQLIAQAFAFLLVALALLAVPAVAGEYLLSLVVLSLIFAIIANGYNIIYGYAGQFSFAHMAMAAIGGYISALGMIKLGLSFWLVFPLGILVVAGIAYMVAIPGFNLRGHYFGISTLALGELIILFINNMKSITHGAEGLLVLVKPDPIHLGAITISFAVPDNYYYLVLLFYVLTTVAMWRLSRSFVGAMWLAIQGNEVLAESIGIDTKRYKTLAFVIGCGMAALGGSLYAHYISYLTPEAFSAFGTVEVLMMVLIGGKGTILGPLIGALLLTALPQVISLLPTLRLILYGSILIVVILLIPQGIVGGSEALYKWMRLPRVTLPKPQL